MKAPYRAVLFCVALLLAALTPAFADGVFEKWARRFNGPGNGTDVARAVVVDGSGKIIVTGSSTNLAGNADYYTVKYAPADGTLVWEKFYNGTGGGSDYPLAVAVDNDGNVVATGSSYGSGGSNDYYTAKYAAADGALLWEKRYNGTGNSDDSAFAVAVDGSGDVIVTGSSYGSGSDNDFYTAKYAAADGALLWEKRYNGPANGADVAKAVALDSSGNVIVTGYSFGGASDNDYYTAKYAAADGALIWEKRYNGTGNNADIAEAVAVDSSDNVIVTGSSFGIGLNTDYYTAKYAAANGALLWEKRYNGTGGGADSAKAVAVDAGNNVVVTGHSTGSGSGVDYYTAKYGGAGGALLWEQRYNGPLNRDDYGQALALSTTGDVIVAGYSSGIGSGTDYCTLKYAGTDGTPLWEKRYNGLGNGEDIAQAVTIDGSGNVIVTGYSTGSGGNFDHFTVKYGEAPIRTSSVATGKVGVAFDYQVSPTSNPATYRGTDLPGEFGIDPATGRVTGTPGSAGIFDATIVATTASGTVLYPLTIAIAPAGFDPDAPDLSLWYGHGLRVTNIVASGNWNTGGYSGTVTIFNPSATASFNGRIEVNYIISGSAELKDLVNFPSIPAGGTIDVQIPDGSVGAQPAGDLYVTVSEQIGPSYFKVQSSFALDYVTYPTVPATGAAVATDITISAPGFSSELPTLVKVAVSGAARVDENSTATFAARAIMSDGSSPNVGVSSWGSSLFSISPSGVLTTGEVTGNAPITVNAVMTVAGATKFGSLVAELIDLGPSHNAGLASLATSAGALTPSFASGTTNYAASVPNTTTSVTVTPMVAYSAATVKANGVNVPSGSSSGAVPLAVGSNPITTVVTAEDGTTTKTYTITVTRAAPAPDNADLAALATSAGAIAPAFASGTTSYAAGVPNATASITVTPTVSDGGATVKVNGVTVASGSPSGAIPLSVGSNVVTTVVTAQNGTTTKTYTITVTRAAGPGNNADLASLATTAGTLTPAFASGTTGYTASVPNATSSITVTPTLSDTAATVTVNGVTVASGSASGAIPLSVGSNAVSAVVTAQNGTTTKTYTITITRAAPVSNNASLASLTTTAGALTPVFASGTTSYTASVPNTTASITVTPTVADSGATVKVNTVTVASGSASGAISLVVGSNVIGTVVTAQDGTTTKSYTITVTRAAPAAGNADLASLATSAGALAPGFASGTTSYTAGVPNATASITVTPTVADGGATVKVNGVAVASGSPSGAIALSVGSNVIATVVTAQNGTTTKSYAITVTRAAPAAGNADLASLATSAGSLTPGFASGTTSYTASVPNATASITVTPTVADGGATARVNGVTVASGTPSGAIALSVGSNVITATVTAQDGTTTKTYTITVTRGSPVGTNADLASLATSAGALTPGFTSATTSYTASVPNSTASITVTPTVADSGATVKVNGVTVASGSPSAAVALQAGSNAITTLVTAQDGSTTKTYTITLTRAAPSPSNADLASLTTSVGALAPGFASGTTNYTASVPNTTASITVTPTVSDSGATVKVNGVTVISGSASGALPLSVGANVISTVVTAQNGTTTKTYAITVTRAASVPGNADLASLVISAGSLAPGFASGTTDYAATVPNATASVTVTPTASDSGASVKVNGVTVASGTPSGAIALTVGSNIITTVVTAQNGTTTKSYAIVMIRSAPSPTNAELSSLAISSGTLTPAFNRSISSYTAAVPFSTASVSVTPAAAESAATVRVNGATVSAGSASALIPLIVGINSSILVVVTAPDGTTTKTYAITVTRAQASQSNADLASLTASNGTLSPAFSSAATSYNTTVDNTTGSIAFTPTVVQAAATVKVNGIAVTSGAASQPIPLNVGSNFPVQIVVTAPDGATTKTYVITVTRAEPPTPVSELGGNYLGLLEATADSPLPGVHEGLVRISVLRTGAFTGWVKLGGLTIPLKGQVFDDGRLRFDRLRTATKELIRKARPANISLGHLELTLDTAANADRITGTLKQGATTVAQLPHANRALYTSRRSPTWPYRNVPAALANPLGNKGRYTALFIHSAAPNNGLAADKFPQGEGWAKATIAASGNVTIAGRLADGTVLSYSQPLSKANELAVYVPLYVGRRGFISGRVAFDPAQPETDASAAGMKWFKPRNDKDTRYPLGWPAGITMDFAASKFIVPARPTRTNGTPFYVLGTDNILGLVGKPPAPVEFSLADVWNTPATGISVAGTVNEKNAISIPADASLKLKPTLTAGTGRLGGSFKRSGNNKTVNFSGVVYQKTHSAGGYFLYYPPRLPGGPAPSGVSGGVGIAPAP
jgi:hypothetical protein